MQYIVTTNFTGKEREEIEWAANPFRILFNGFHEQQAASALGGDKETAHESACEIVQRRMRGALSGNASLPQLIRLRDVLAALSVALQHESDPDFQKNWIKYDGVEEDRQPQTAPTAPAWEAMRSGGYAGQGAALFTDPQAAADALQEVRKDQLKRTFHACSLVNAIISDVQKIQQQIDSTCSANPNYDIEE